MFNIDVNSIKVTVNVNPDMVRPGGGNIPFAEDVPHYFRAHHRGIVVFAVEVHLFHALVFSPFGEGIEGDLERFFLRHARCVAPKPETDRINSVTHRAVIKDKGCPEFPVAVRIGIQPGQRIRIYCQINHRNHSVSEKLTVIRERGL